MDQPRQIGLYVHWPYCLAKCPYCDFNSHVSAKIDESDWIRAYLSELDRVAAEVPQRVLSSIYFGGGTPSLMSPALVRAVIDAARAAWPTANDLEVTLEANPTSVEAGRFAGYRAAGVNRVSIGVQSLIDADLAALGRRHSAAEAVRAVRTANAIFDRVSFDLIYARQNQTLPDWKRELDRALDLAAGHLSLYQLTVEPGTAFGDRHARGRLRGLPDENLAADMFEHTQQACLAAGMPAYEVSNHARPGEESRHNLIYWRCGDYAGIGPGAHGRLTLADGRVATESERMPDRWLAMTADTGNGETARTPLTAQEQAAEVLLMGLRTGEGISLKRYQALADRPINQNKINDLRDLGLILTDGDRLVATVRGRQVLNAVLAELAS